MRSVYYFFRLLFLLKSENSWEHQVFSEKNNPETKRESSKLEVYHVIVVPIITSCVTKGGPLDSSGTAQVDTVFC